MLRQVASQRTVDRIRRTAFRSSCRRSRDGDPLNLMNRVAAGTHLRHQRRGDVVVHRRASPRFGVRCIIGRSKNGDQRERIARCDNSFASRVCTCLPESRAAVWGIALAIPLTASSTVASAVERIILDFIFFLRSRGQVYVTPKSLINARLSRDIPSMKRAILCKLLNYYEILDSVKHAPRVARPHCKKNRQLRSRAT